MRLTQFAIPHAPYILPFPAQTYGQMVFGGRSPNTVSIPGGWGGIDLDGAETARRDIGNVRVSYWLHAADGPLARQTRDLFRAANQGLGRLFSDPGDGYPTRWAWAKINNVAIDPETPAAVPHRRRRVTLDFQVVSPRWYSRENQNYGVVTGAPYGITARYTAALYAHGDIIQITNNGDEFAPAEVIIKSTSTAWTLGATHNIGDPGLQIGGYGGAFTDFEIRRLDYLDEDVDGFDYNGGLTASGQTLTVNTADKSVTASWTSTLSDYISNFVPFRAGWLQIAPGTHNYRVYMGSIYEAATIEIDFWDAWSEG